WAFLCVIVEDKINHLNGARLKHSSSEIANAKDGLCLLKCQTTRGGFFSLDSRLACTAAANLYFDRI
ncbi:MAG: hypothetical protein ACKOHM_10655, partial [Spartobacteria bacterium]